MDTNHLSCRSCGAAELHPILSLGESPLADRLLTEAELNAEEPTAPLDAVFCPKCGLMQLAQSIPPEDLFCRNYPYYSSVSPSLMEHFAKSAESIIADRKLGATDTVIEIASNDGYMLQTFRANGIPVLGIDPASGPASVANEAGIPTRNAFFTEDLADRLRRGEGIAADVVLANNVLAHVPDLNGFVKGIRTLMKPHGQAVIEVPYAVDLVDKLEFDTIYHQHLCYFTVTALDHLFRRNELSLNHVERTSIHGGSLRLFVEHAPTSRDSVEAMLRTERERGVDTLAYYTAFAERTEGLRQHLMELLEDIRSRGNRIVGYGAAAKGTTLMNFCGIDERHLDYVVDLSPYKQGLYTCGNKLKIKSPEEFLQDQPDYALILAWNFANEIIEQRRDYLSAGGRFIIPIPEPRVIPGS